MLFSKYLAAHLLSATLASAVALDSNLLARSDANTLLAFDPPKEDKKSPPKPSPPKNNPPPPPKNNPPPPPKNNPPPPPKNNPPPPKGNPPPPKHKQYPLGTKPFSGGKISSAHWEKWVDYCHGHKKRSLDSAAVGLTPVEQDGVRGNLGFEELDTKDLRTCFGIVITGKATTGPSPPKSNAILWHMSGSVAQLNGKWDDVVKIINESGLEEKKAYLSIPDDHQPKVKGWTGPEGLIEVHKQAFAKLKEALEKVDIRDIKVKHRPDASEGSTMKVTKDHHIFVDNKPW